MRVPGRRKSVVFFIAFGVTLVCVAVGLNVGWILLTPRQVFLLVIGIVLFALIIAGLILNTIFLVREIRRNEAHDSFINAVTHELKTPLASIRLYLETLQTRDLPEAKRAEFYRIMLADNDRLPVGRGCCGDYSFARLTVCTRHGWSIPQRTCGVRAAFKPTTIRAIRGGSHFSHSAKAGTTITMLTRPSPSTDSHGTKLI